MDSKEKFDEKSCYDPRSPYSASKAASDLLTMSYQNIFGTDISIIRPFNNYGPRQNDGSYAGIIPITINRIFNGLKPIIYGDGMQTRDYIYVKDTGKGVPQALRARVFNPGFTTKKRGWGLGLALTKRIVHDYHGGEIRIVESQPGKGTTFLVRFPAV